VKTIKGNLLDQKGILGHQVNMQGVMGAGLALAIRQTWPAVFAAYQNHRGYLGECFITYAERDVWVANLYGQDRLGRGTRQTNYGALSNALRELRFQSSDSQVYLPVGLGCGLAGGDWNIVRELIEYYVPHAILVDFGGKR
jgi:O-acetyl-ADP-ribose deacetylase (regulator of RNase III)